MNKEVNKEVNKSDLIKDLTFWPTLTSDQKKTMITPLLINHRDTADWYGNFENMILTPEGLEVMDALHQVTAEILDRGRQHIGTGYAFEVIRHMTPKTHGDGLFKINNTYNRSYITLLKLLHEDLHSVFENRRPPHAA